MNTYGHISKHTNTILNYINKFSQKRKGCEIYRHDYTTISSQNIMIKDVSVMIIIQMMLFYVKDIKHKVRLFLKYETFKQQKMTLNITKLQTILINKIYNV